jgi:hypothetical protein
MKDPTNEKGWKLVEIPRLISEYRHYDAREMSDQTSPALEAILSIMPRGRTAKKSLMTQMHDPGVKIVTTA